MTTDTPVYDGLRKLLPKLAQPSWVWQIGEVIRKNETLAALHADTADKKAKKKAAKAAYKKHCRLVQATAGVRLRNMRSTHPIAA